MPDSPLRTLHEFDEGKTSEERAATTIQARARGMSIRKMVSILRIGSSWCVLHCTTYLILLEITD